MDRETQYLLYVLFILIFGYVIMTTTNNKEDNEIIIETKKLEFKNDIGQEDPLKKFDINTVQKRGFEIKGISSRRSGKILDYRKKFGAITDLDDLKNIKGIGPKTLEDIKDNFLLNEDTIKDIGIKKVNINKIGENTLSSLGFNKKEIEKIKKWRKDNGRIFSNVDLIRILGESRYYDVQKRISYE